VKLLLDENLSPRLCEQWKDLFPDSTHVHHCDLGSADDEKIWEFALAGGYIIVSKDLDYYERSILRGNPPKVIWLRTGNCSTRDIEALFRASFDLISQFAQDSHDSALLLP